MATKKSGKSSKTAHVLNVLSAPTGEGTEPEMAAPIAAEPARAARSAKEAALISDAAREEEDARISEEIRKNLMQDLERLEEEEGALEEQEQLEKPQPEPVLVQEEPLAEEFAVNTPLPVEPMSEASPITEPITEALPVEGPMQEEPEKEGVAAEPVEEPPAQSPKEHSEVPEARKEEKKPSSGISHFLSLAPDESIGYVNVMQALVEEKAPKFLNMFEVCPCSRCAADVRALALTNLPAKYAVMEKGDVIPMLTVYEGRYSQAITAQLMKACDLVGKKPRHS